MLDGTTSSENRSASGAFATADVILSIKFAAGDRGEIDTETKTLATSQYVDRAILEERSEAK